MDDAVAVGRVPRVLGEPGQPDGLAQARPLPLAADGHRELAVGRAEGLVRHQVGVGVAHPDRRRATHERVLRLVDEDGERRFEERHVDPLPADVRPRRRVAGEQAGQDRDRAEQPGDDVADRHADLGRPSPVLVRRPRDRHQPADRLDHEVVARLRRIGAVGAEPRDREVHEVRVELAERGVAEPERGHPADAVVLDQHVRPREEPTKHLATGVGLQVEPDRALVPVDREEVGGRPRAVGLVADPRRPPAPRRVAVGRLDLDHVRAEVGEQHRAVRAGQDRGAVGDADPRERPETRLEVAAARRRSDPARQVCHRPMVARPRQRSETSVAVGHGRMPMGAVARGPAD